MNNKECVLTESDIMELPVKSFVAIIFRHSSKEVTYPCAHSPADFLSLYSGKNRFVRFIGGNGKFVCIDKHDVVGMIVSPKA